jgi:hypothetical protein
LLTQNNAVITITEIHGKGFSPLRDIVLIENKGKILQAFKWEHAGAVPDTSLMRDRSGDICKGGLSCQ